MNLDMEHLRRPDGRCVISVNGQGHLPCTEHVAPEPPQRHPCDESCVKQDRGFQAGRCMDTCELDDDPAGRALHEVLRQQPAPERAPGGEEDRPQRCPTYDPATDECSCWALPSPPAPGPGEPDTAAIRAEGHVVGGFCDVCDDAPCRVLALCDALDAQRADNARLREERDDLRRQVDFVWAERKAANIVAQAASGLRDQRNDARSRLAEIRALCDGHDIDAESGSVTKAKLRPILDRPDSLSPAPLPGGAA